MKTSGILLMAGSGTRSGLNINKVLYRINNIPLFMYSFNKLINLNLDEYILVVSEKDYQEVCIYLEETIKIDNLKIIIGGSTRAESVKKAISNVTCDIALIHDAARPLTNTFDLNNLLQSAKEDLCGTLYHDVTDTIKQVTTSVSTINRNSLRAVTTPQFFNKQLFTDILNNNSLEITDEITLFETNFNISFVKETTPNIKLTTFEDLEYIEYMLSTKYNYLIGQSLDYHPFDDHGELVLGGVIFNNYPILKGHSDADVVYHVVCEALLGATSLGDLGTLFPDTDMKYKGINSGILLKEVVDLLKQKNFEIINIDVMVYLIKPSLKDYKTKMAQNIKTITNCFNVCVKAATLNKHGLIALNEGIGAEAVCLIKQNH